MNESVVEGDRDAQELGAILSDRESRGRRRAELAARWPCSALVQLSLATPGARKNGGDIEAAVELGTRMWDERSSALGLRTFHRESQNGSAGPYRLWVVEADARAMKSLTIGLEDGYSLGRLWDFDVYGPGGSKLDRETVGSDSRRCFVCGSPALICAGRRLHEPAEVARRFMEILERGIEELAKKGVCV